MFPIAQDQWLNIFLLNKNEFSFYQILYFISGFLFPLLVINNSLHNFYNYKFNTNKYKSKQIKYISYLIIFTSLVLSILINKYFIFTIRNIIPQKALNINFDLKLEVLLLLLISTLLFFNKSKMLIKKLFLLNFFIIFIVSWSAYVFNLLGIETFINKYIFTDALLNFNGLNIFNIIYLLVLEVFYYLWSFISYQKNISDWSIPYPSKSDTKHIFQIIIFYFGVILYYFIFNQIS